MNHLDPSDPQWTEGRLLHEGVWLVERFLYNDLSEVAAWAKFVRRVWTAQNAKGPAIASQPLERISTEE